MNNLSGVLLINLGTPDAANVSAVRRYLKQFLSDPRVIELPTVFRWLLVNAVILPFRAKKTTQAYASIWQSRGSPLLTNTLDMQAALQEMLGDKYVVAVGMRYGQPSIAAALNHLHQKKIDSLLVIPLFPQYASAVNGSALELTMKILAKNKEILPCRLINQFAVEEDYIQASAENIRPYLGKQHYLLMSFHGLPERQMINPGVSCYKTKCLQSAQQIAKKLGLNESEYSVSFQSRLGRLPWIKPYTDQVLAELRARGIKRVLVTCPSFVADCLETLEEIGIRAKEQWLEMGGEDLQLIPCLNANPVWISALHNIIKKNAVLVPQHNLDIHPV